MGDYKLSASLQGHEDDVRAVAFPEPKTILSASRDATVKLWKRLSLNPPSYDATLVSHGSSFVNSLAYVPASSAYPDGLIVSGGKDTIIEVRQPGKPPQDNADALLLGHSANVCALDVSQDGGIIVSGGWDAEARVWQVGKWEAAAAVLQGHEQSVWAVLAYDKETILTGCADKLIRAFHPSGKLLRTIRGSSDVVRALCRLTPNHPSGAQFASAGNDGIIRLWTLQGKQTAQLKGHESFIYSLACLPNGDLVSSSEDRTARVWKGNECIQTITHPAISIWSVAVCQENGDIVTGASDRVVRVFSREKDRQAPVQELQAFEDSLKSFSIPKQSMGDVQKQQHPGPEFLKQKSGTKEGQIQVIQEPNGSLSAYQWSQTGQQWINIGTVVDSAGSSGRKREFMGQDYDYVFDVDIEEGKPPLKLPFNLSQNPYEVAQKFIADNELPISYVDQVTNFIITNTQGATLDQTSQTGPLGSDPWGQESRYRPGEVGSPAPPSQPEAAARPKVLPQTQYLSIRTANVKAIQKKINDINEELLTQGSKDISLNPSELKILAALCKQLEEASAATSTAPVLREGIELVLKLITVWPPDKRFPGLDLLRLLTAASPAPATYISSPGDETIVDILSKAGIFTDTDRPNDIMLAVRVLANLFETEEGRFIADGEFDDIHALVKPLMKSSGNTNRNLTIALTTLYINYAVFLTSPATTPDRGLALLEDLVALITTEKDSEALYRALVGAGTLLSMGEEVRIAAKEMYGIEDALKKAEGRAKEPRIRAVIGEIRNALA